MSAIVIGMQTIPCVSFRLELDLAAAWASRLLELLAEHEDLELIVDGQDTSTGDTTENVGTSTLEERLDTLLGDNLLSGIEGRLVLDSLQLLVRLVVYCKIKNVFLLTSPEVIIIRRRTVSRG